MNALSQNRLDQIANEFRSLHQSGAASLALACKHAGEFIISGAASGKLLLEAKAMLKHGQFEDFVQIRLGIPMRTAQRYMGHAKKMEGKENLGPAEQLNLAFSCIDYKPATTRRPTLAARARGLFGELAGFWDWAAKHPVDKWDEEEASEFALDTARRIAMCNQRGLDIPDPETVAPPSIKTVEV
jgi:hypothetical protein